MAPSFIYDGPGNRLRLAGHTLIRGMAVQLDGHAAEAAERHPSVSAVGAPQSATAAASGDSAGSSPPAGLAERRALVARAKQLGIPATGKSAALAAAIAAAEAEAERSDGEGAE